MKTHIIAASAAAFILFFAGASSYYYVVSVYAHPTADGKATIKNVSDEYLIAFQQYPEIARTGENATLHFTILDSSNSSSVLGVYVAMLMKEKDSGKVVEQMPYRFYEVGDISIPYHVSGNEDYVVTLMARTNKDPSELLQAGFELSVGQTMSSGTLLMMFVPFAAALTGSILFLLKRK
ncbi:MAG TPA: hypothetical protein VNI77_10225 [Nitrososphaera sp.]|nr:hypothetical protein [Nitrososphaera sp.]